MRLRALILHFYIFIDAIHYSVRDNGIIRKLAAYVILGITCSGHKEVLTIQVGENESAKYWLSVLNELKNRGVKDIMIICADGLSGIKEAIMPLLLAEILNFQGSTHLIGVGSLSYIFLALAWW